MSRPAFGDYGVDSEQMVRSLHSRDDLTLVVRGHICLEAALSFLLMHAVPEGLAHLETLSFAGKVDLAIALGQVPIELRRTWLGVNAIRNRFAHDLDATLDKAAVDALYPIQGPVDSQIAISRMPMRPGTSAHARLAYVMAMLWTHAINQFMTERTRVWCGADAVDLRAEIAALRDEGLERRQSGSGGCCTPPSPRSHAGRQRPGSQAPRASSGNRSRGPR
jgi:hypothetical protein